MTERCDNKSVGVIIANNAGDILLIERAKFPYGLAPPAGHVDKHASVEQTALTEVFEEVGIALPINALREVIDARRVRNKCRRGGMYHDWTIFVAHSDQTKITRSLDETNSAGWYPSAQLQETARQKYNSIGFEPIWLDFFIELEFVIL